MTFFCLLQKMLIDVYKLIKITGKSETSKVVFIMLQLNYKSFCSYFQQSTIKCLNQQIESLSAAVQVLEQRVSLCCILIFPLFSCRGHGLVVYRFKFFSPPLYCTCTCRWEALMGGTYGRHSLRYFYVGPKLWGKLATAVRSAKTLKAFTNCMCKSDLTNLKWYFDQTFTP